MLKCVSKIFTGVLAISCLSVAALNVRLMMDTSHSVKLKMPSVRIASKIAEKNNSIVKEFETKLAEINFENVEVKNKKFVATKPKVEKIAAKATQLKTELINFEEPVKLSPVKVEYSLPTNLIALMPSFDFDQKVMVAEVKVEESKEEKVEDKISTVLASTTVSDEEPVFFEYPAEASVKETKVTETSKVEVQNKLVNQKPQYTKEDFEKMADEFIAFDYSDTNGSQASEKITTFNVASPVKTNTKKAESKKVSAKVAAVASTSKMTTQKMNSQKEELNKEQNLLTTQKKNILASVMSIQATGTNLRKVHNVKNFEVRFQDDLNEIYEDYGSGEVQIASRVNNVMNRSMVLLKRGYAPTNTDLIVENNSKVTLPLIEEEVFNELLDKNEGYAASGALLVEFDDETETVLLDTEYAEEISLDQNLKATSSEDYRYKLFVGLPAGNVYLIYKKFDGSEVSKIVHIHEREITFEANIYENVKHQSVSLYEEGLLSKELSPLIVSGEQVRIFATEKTSQKLSQNTYKLNQKMTLLGGRQYLEVNHLDEPVFVGYRDNAKIILPSENFISFVLSKFEDRKLGNRCIIQVNIDTPVANFSIASESVANGLVTSSQVLDQDGKFYDSVGPKSNKIIILGENFGPIDQSQDGKVNIKIDYLDGSTRFLSSYCSPNTYLVEQL